MRVIVLFKEGYEEIEALSTVDVLRRAGVSCDMVGMDEEYVKSARNILIKMDKVFDESDKDADVVVLPGGLPGATSLRDDTRVIELVQKLYNEKKIVAAICAAPIVLEKAGILKGKNFTCYPGFEKEAVSGNYQDVLMCVDDNIVTARGPAASLAFAYAVLEKCGIDSTSYQNAMQYPYLTK